VFLFWVLYYPNECGRGFGCYAGDCRFGCQSKGASPNPFLTYTNSVMHTRSVASLTPKLDSAYRLLDPNLFFKFETSAAHIRLVS